DSQAHHTMTLFPYTTALPISFYQFWFNSGDADVVRYLKYFSFKSHEEIEELARATEEKPAARLAQKALAEELTTLLHGAEETERSEEHTSELQSRENLVCRLL